MSRYWVSSDLHFFHKEILDFCADSRPYHNVDEMHEDIVNNINHVVKPDDIYIHLGDIAMNARPETYKPFIERINCRRIAIRGNHCPSAKKLLFAGFHEVHEEMYIIHEGKTVWLAHIPVDNASDKRKLMRPEATMPYDVALCGHVHSAWMIGPAGEINVGVDQWNMSPVNMSVAIKFALAARCMKRYKVAA